MEKDSKVKDSVISYHLDFKRKSADGKDGCLYEIENFSACVIDYRVTQFQRSIIGKIKGRRGIKQLFEEFLSLYKEYEDRLIFEAKPFVLSKDINTIFIKTMTRLGLIKDETDFVFGYDCLDISDIYLMYYFCKSSKVEKSDLETMLGDFGILPQEKGTPFFKTVNSSRLGIQMIKNRL